MKDYMKIYREWLSNPYFDEDTKAELKAIEHVENEIKERFPGCMVVHLDPNEIQGIPDLLVLYESTWAALEGKRSIDAPHRPNQDYYVNLMNRMSFAAFICPENKEEILNDLQRAFEVNRAACLPRR